MGQRKEYKMSKLITDDETLAWLGSDVTFKDLVNIITEIANGDYLVEDLKKDIEGYENE